MPFDPSIRLTFSQRVEKTATSLKIFLDVEEPFDALVDRKGWFKSSQHDFQTRVMETPISVNFFDGRSTYNSLRNRFVPNLGSLEIVNHHAWKGEVPFTIKNNSGQPLMTERTIWSIVGVDQVALERHSFSFSHADKDDVFRLQMRLTQIFDVVRDLLKPWDDVVRMHYAQGYESLEDVPREHRESSSEMISDVLRQWDENTPVWAK